MSTMMAFYLALRELLRLDRSSFKSRLAAAQIRLLRIKELRWGSSARVKAVVNNLAPVSPPAYIRCDSEISTHQYPLDAKLSNCAVYEFAPSDGPAQGTIVYLHGGGYVHPPGDKQWKAARRLVREYHLHVIFPIYPKGPTYKYTDAYPPLLKLLERTAARAAHSGYLLMGDSAGGGLAMGLVLALRDESRLDIMPTEVILFSPWTDLALSNPDLVAQNDRDPWLDLHGLREAAAMWAGSDAQKLSDPFVSPYYASLRAPLPPISMSVGSRELFYPDQLLFWRKLLDESEGTACQHLEVAPGMIHVYGLIPGLPEARGAWRDVEAAISRL